MQEVVDALDVLYGARPELGPGPESEPEAESEEESEPAPRPVAVSKSTAASSQAPAAAQTGGEAGAAAGVGAQSEAGGSAQPQAAVGEAAMGGPQPEGQLPPVAVSESEVGQAQPAAQHTPSPEGATIPIRATSQGVLEQPDQHTYVENGDAGGLAVPETTGGEEQAVQAEGGVAQQAVGAGAGQPGRVECGEGQSDFSAVEDEGQSDVSAAVGEKQIAESGANDPAAPVAQAAESGAASPAAPDEQEAAGPAAPFEFDATGSTLNTIDNTDQLSSIYTGPRIVPTEQVTGNSFSIWESALIKRAWQLPKTLNSTGGTPPQHVCHRWRG